MNATLQLWPIALHALLTLAIYPFMSRTRVRLVVDGKVKAGVFRDNRNEPEESLRFSNAIRNQNETGPIFYAACLAAFVLTPTLVTVILAWLFLTVKTLHLAVHVTTNRLRHRRPLFALAYLVLVAHWLAVMAQMADII